MPWKTCPDCGERKPLDEFGRDRKRRGGRTSYCRVCLRARAKIDNARRATAKREWASKHDRGTCPQCGGPMGVGARRRGTMLCRTCRAEAVAAATEALYTRIAEMWNRGLSRREIATEIGTTPGTVQQYVHRMRLAGWSVPLRGPSQKVAA